MNTSNKRSGMTLIELIIVIAIFAILAGITFPKFNRLYLNTQIAATTAIAGALSAANAANFATRKVNHTAGIAIANCTDVAKTLQSGLPNEYLINSASIASDASATCTLIGPESTTATFT